MKKIEFSVRLSVWVLGLVWLMTLSANAQRIRDFGINPGNMKTGPLNAVTDVTGVRVGQITLYDEGKVCTGVTAILPHPGNLFRDKVPAAVYVGNGFGKLMGFTQIRELGTLETPVILTNTLSVPMAAQGVLEYMLSLPGNEKVRSVNPFVGETNDGYMNDIRGFHVRPEHIKTAIEKAKDGPVDEGSVGAGTGAICFGFKGGIGTSSRLTSGYTVGVLVQTNFGGVLSIDGIPAAELLRENQEAAEKEPSPDGSCMIILATDAPLDSRNLERMAKRAILGLARTGGIASNGSGDYVLAFSTALECREKAGNQNPLTGAPVVKNDAMTPLFQAAIEATEEAIYNSLTMATAVKGFQNHHVPLLPLKRILALYAKSKETKK